MTYYINTQTNAIYTGDMQANSRPASEAEVAEWTRDKRTYAQKRQAEYPSLGDMIDAFCKAKAGDETELKSLMSKRLAIKAKYPKESNA